MKILVIVAHPDDEVLGMGGTIKKLTKNGNDVKVIFLATGIFARRSNDYKNKPLYDVEMKVSKSMKKQVIKLQKDARTAAKILGVKDLEFVDFPDNEMDLISNLEIAKKIEQIITEFQPYTVFTHTQYDVNVDHRALYNATLTATRPTPKNKVKEVISFEIPSSTEWYFPSKFSPNIFFDITKELPIKLKALNAYKDEIREFPHPRSTKALEIISKRWGTVSGFKAAEAFCLIRQLRNKF